MNEFQQKIIDLSITIGPILLLTIVAIIISRTLVFKSLMAFANTSDSKHDDVFVTSLKKQLTLVTLGVGLYALVNALPLSETYAQYGLLLDQT